MKELLAIDVGNSYAKCALFKDGNIAEVWRHQSSDPKGAAQEFLAKSKAPVALSSVVPAVTSEIEAMCLETKRPIYIVTPKSQNILSNMHPEMGADRIAASAAAWKIYGQGKMFTIFMSFGTATTLLTISAQGKIGGGFIAPGVSMMFQVLHEKTALLPHLAMQGAECELGHDTESHMRNGVLVGHVGLIKEWIAVAKKGVDGPSVTVVSGGWDETLQKHCHSFDFIDQDLTLRGVYLLAEASHSL